MSDNEEVPMPLAINVPSANEQAEKDAMMQRIAELEKRLAEKKSAKSEKKQSQKKHSQKPPPGTETVHARYRHFESFRASDQKFLDQWDVPKNSEKARPPRTVQLRKRLLQFDIEVMEKLVAEFPEYMPSDPSDVLKKHAKSPDNSDNEVEAEEIDTPLVIEQSEPVKAPRKRPAVPLDPSVEEKPVKAPRKRPAAKKTTTPATAPQTKKIKNSEQ